MFNKYKSLSKRDTWIWMWISMCISHQSLVGSLVEGGANLPSLWPLPQVKPRVWSFVWKGCIYCPFLQCSSSKLKHWKLIMQHEFCCCSKVVFPKLVFSYITLVNTFFSYHNSQVRHSSQNYVTWLAQSTPIFSENNVGKIIWSHHHCFAWYGDFFFLRV